MKYVIPALILLLTSCALQKPNIRTYKKFSDTTFKVGDIIHGPDIVFDLNSSEVLPESRDSVQVIANFYMKHPSFKIEIGVHTDTRGSKKSNTMLSELRGRSIILYLTGELSVPSTNIFSKGYGEDEPIISDDIIQEVYHSAQREVLHAINRRVEIKILSTE